MASRLLAPTCLSILEGSEILLAPNHPESPLTRLVIWYPVEHSHETHIPASLLVVPEEPGEKEIVQKAINQSYYQQDPVSIQTL